MCTVGNWTELDSIRDLAHETILYVNIGQDGLMFDEKTVSVE